MLCMTFLIFFHLGHYAFWDDEAICALFAKSLFEHGDTSAVSGHNLIAFNDGRELENLHQRYVPPLQFYFAAPFVGQGGGSTFIARFPFAVCGLLTVAVIFLWLWRSRAPVYTWLLMSAGILGNVSFILSCRQCRYYALSMLLTVLLAFLYYFRTPKKQTVLAMAGVSLLLLASNYLCYAAVMGCLIMHDIIWGRKRHASSRSDILLFWGMQLFLGGLIVLTYNPLGKNVWDISSDSWLRNRTALFFWNFRDLNSCEMGVGILIALCPFLYFYKKDRRFLQCPALIVTYILIVSLFTPHPFDMLWVAFVRYLCPLIPLCIYTAVLVIQTLSGHRRWLLILLAFLAFGTNVLHGGPLTRVKRHTAFSHAVAHGHFRSTFVEYFNELLTARPNPYQLVSDWINGNLQTGDTVWVVPGYANYPLMFHAPKVVYAWQLTEKQGQFSNLPDIHFKGEEWPDYIIAFGPNLLDVFAFFENKEEAFPYEMIDQINIFWSSLTRPELFWHSFREIENYSLATEAIYIFKFSE